MKRKREFQLDHKRLGARIQALRQSAGLTQRQLSEITGMQLKRISEIENGRPTTGETLHRIADALGISLDFVAKV